MRQPLYPLRAKAVSHCRSCLLSSSSSRPPNDALMQADHVSALQSYHDQCIGMLTRVDCYINTAIHAGANLFDLIANMQGQQLQLCVQPSMQLRKA